MQSNHDNPVPHKRDVRRCFDRAATQFDGADFAHSVTRNGLLDRLAPMTIDAGTVLDLGAGTGASLPALRRKFRGAHIIAADLSHNMLTQATAKRGWFSKVSLLQADAEALPLADHSVDVVFSNFMLPWIGEPGRAFSEVARVLRKDGLFLFATLGPDSIGILRQAWSMVDSQPHTNRFLDMHDIGDAVVRSGLRDPVLDVDHLTITYAESTALIDDLTATGARNSLSGRERSLVSASRLQDMTKQLEQLRKDGLIELELELVYGHCWGAGMQAGSGEFRVDAGQIGRRGR